MSRKIELFAAYLGHAIFKMLSEAPFKDWPFRKSVDIDLDPPRINYEFLGSGLDVTCDQNDRIATIFIYYGEDRRFEDDIAEFPPSATRQVVNDKFGLPAKKSDGLSDPVLGTYGPWDRFARTDYSIHVEYQVGVDRIKMVTLIRNDMVPA